MVEVQRGRETIQNCTAARWQPKWDALLERFRRIAIRCPQRDQIEHMIEMHVREHDRIERTHIDPSFQFAHRAASAIDEHVGRSGAGEEARATRTGIATRRSASQNSQVHG